MNDFHCESLSHDPIHGYIPFIAHVDENDEVAERKLIDHPWVQRLRQIHQLQTAWWVYPTAEHTRFQHVIGAMHLASRMVNALYESLKAIAPEAPSRGYVECLTRTAALLHDVGHGPFGHFFDQHFLAQYDLTHETLGAQIIERELGELVRGIRRCPNSCLESGERLLPEQVAYLIQRPQQTEAALRPRWLILLRSLFCGIYTVDNMDFVLRDAFMSGYSTRSFDVERLLRYTFFSNAGLTIHPRGMDALVRFMQVRSELFRSVYFHRTVRAIDLTLETLFMASKPYLFPGNPRHHLNAYQTLTEWSLMVDVSRWHRQADPVKQKLGLQWQSLFQRNIKWRAACERNVVFSRDEKESSSIFADAQILEQSLRRQMPDDFETVSIRVDLPRHMHRPHTPGAAMHQNFLYEPTRGITRPLTDNQLFDQLPLSHRVCRIFVLKETPTSVDRLLTQALDHLIGSSGNDDPTNM